MKKPDKKSGRVKEIDGKEQEGKEKWWSQEEYGTGVEKDERVWNVFSPHEENKRAE